MTEIRNLGRIAENLEAKLQAETDRGDHIFRVLREDIFPEIHTRIQTLIDYEKEDRIDVSTLVKLHLDVVRGIRKLGICIDDKPLEETITHYNAALELDKIKREIDNNASLRNKYIEVGKYAKQMVSMTIKSLTVADCSPNKIRDAIYGIEDCSTLVRKSMDPKELMDMLQNYQTEKIEFEYQIKKAKTRKIMALATIAICEDEIESIEQSNIELSRRRIKINQSLSNPGIQPFDQFFLGLNQTYSGNNYMAQFTILCYDAGTKILETLAKAGVKIKLKF